MSPGYPSNTAEIVYCLETLEYSAGRPICSMALSCCLRQHFFQAVVQLLQRLLPAPVTGSFAAGPAIQNRPGPEKWPPAGNRGMAGACLSPGRGIMGAGPGLVPGRMSGVWRRRAGDGDGAWG